MLDKLVLNVYYILLLSKSSSCLLGPYNFPGSVLFYIHYIFWHFKHCEVILSLFTEENNYMQGN